MTITEQLNLIAEGVDPSTGEVFDITLLNKPDVANAIIRLLWKALPGRKGLPNLIPCNSLNRPTNRIFEQLRDWRLNEAQATGLPAYCIFTDRQLYNIAESDICHKEELHYVNGISQEKYDLYADAIFDILKEHI